MCEVRVRTSFLLVFLQLAGNKNENAHLLTVFEKVANLYKKVIDRKARKNRLIFTFNTYYKQKCFQFAPGRGQKPTSFSALNFFVYFSELIMFYFLPVEQILCPYMC
jgi:hypothetical protein